MEKEPQIRDLEAEKEKKERFHNIKELSLEDARILMERVERSNGLIRVIVHPFYIRESNYKNWDQNNAIRRIENSIKKMAQMRPEDTPPIFIMFEEPDFDIIEGRKNGDLSDNFEEVKNDLYVIPTRDSGPRPRMTEGSGSSKEAIDKDWAELIDFFKDIGVKKVIVAGMNLNYGISRTRTSEGTERDISYGQCVGATFRQLESEFDTELSAITFPHSKNHLREMEKDIAEVERIERDIRE